MNRILAAPITRRELLGSVVGAAALASGACGVAGPGTDYLNVILHGVFLVSLTKNNTIRILAPSIDGHSYGGYWSGSWRALTGNQQSAGIVPGFGGDADEYAERAAISFPQLKSPDTGPLRLPRKEDWSLELPLPADIRLSRKINSSSNPILQGKDLSNPTLQVAPEVLILRFAIEDWKKVQIASAPVMRGENVNLYSEPALVPPGHGLNSFCSCFLTKLDLTHVAYQAYTYTRPEPDPSMNLAYEDALHLWEMRTEGNAISAPPLSSGPPRCLSFGGQNIEG